MSGLAILKALPWKRLVLKQVNEFTLNQLATLTRGNFLASLTRGMSVLYSAKSLSWLGARDCETQ
jgi:photosystem II stability/assembly factor-like uncharacterized protein